MTLEVVDELQADYEEVAYIHKLTLFYLRWTDMSLDFLAVDGCFRKFYQLEKVLTNPLVKSFVGDIQKDIFWEIVKTLCFIL